MTELTKIEVDIRCEVCGGDLWSGIATEWVCITVPLCKKCKASEQQKAEFVTDKINAARDVTIRALEEWARKEKQNWHDGYPNDVKIIEQAINIVRNGFIG